MNSQQFQYQNYSPAEFEQFRTAVQKDGFTVTQNTIDTVSGHIGSLTYLTGSYNRNQQVLTVTIKSSPWATSKDDDIKSNVTRVVGRGEVAKAPVNTTSVKSATPVTGTGAVVTPKAAVTPPPVAKPAAPVVPAKAVEPIKPAEVAKPAQTPTPAQTPKPADPKPAEVAPATPTESK